MCTLWDFQVFLLLVRRGSELFGVSAQTDSGIRISAFLIYPTLEVIEPISGVHLSETFRYLYSYLGDGLNYWESAA